MLPKTNAYVKCMFVKLNRCIFWSMIMTYWKKYNTIWYKVRAGKLLKAKNISHLSLQQQKAWCVLKNFLHDFESENIGG